MNHPAPIEMTSWLEKILPDALGWLKRMVATNSFTANAPGVNHVGTITAECFAELGFSVEHIPSEHENYGSHLFLSRRGSAGSDPVLLVTHLDTVYPPEEEVKNDFRWRETPSGARVHGPGVVDNKGGTVMIWMMLRAIRQFAPGLFEKCSWTIAANASEEVMARDFAQLTEGRCGSRALMVLVFEGGPILNGEHHLVISRKGRAEYRVTVSGQAAHAGSEFKSGVNAIVSLSKVVTRLAAMTDESRSLTVNVGRIHGGTVLNRVPHEAVAELEMRAFDPGALREAEAAVESLSAAAVKDEAGIRVECLGLSPAWPASAGGNELFNVWKEVASELGLRVIPVARGGLSDANYLAHLGPVLDGLGPSGGHAHCSERSEDGAKEQEYVDTSSFVPKAAMNALAVIRRLQKGNILM